ncbi:MAG: DUF2793 domain-containing protein [Rickettsiales bacterium]
MAATNNLGIALIEQGQAQKEVTANQAFAKIDALLNFSVIDRDLTAPPVSPSAGDAYIPHATATGAWAGRENHIAFYYNNSWNFIVPNEGLAAYVADEGALLVFNGTAWGGFGLQNMPLLGVNATADATNKLSVKSSAILFDNIGAGVQAKLNKAAAGDTASFLFQDGYSGRAEFGCVGDDNFTLKVSPDGAAWNTALVVDKTTGKPTLKKVAFFQDGAAAAPGVAFESDPDTGLFRPASDILAIAAGGSERLRVGAGGLSFDGGANYLGRYERGAFTPTLFGATAAGTTTYTTQDGVYRRVDDLVFGNGRVIWTNATGTGGARIGGLPFAVAAGTGNRGMVNFQYYNSLSMPAGNFPGGYPEPGASYITLRKATESTMSGAMDMTEASTSGEFYFTFIYRA